MPQNNASTGAPLFRRRSKPNTEHAASESEPELLESMLDRLLNIHANISTTTLVVLQATTQTALTRTM